jgi:hypothetical protein
MPQGGWPPRAGSLRTRRNPQRAEGGWQWPGSWCCERSVSTAAQLGGRRKTQDAKKAGETRTYVRNAGVASAPSRGLSCRIDMVTCEDEETRELNQRCGRISRGQRDVEARLPFLCSQGRVEFCLTLTAGGSKLYKDKVSLTMTTSSSPPPGTAGRQSRTNIPSTINPHSFHPSSLSSIRPYSHSRADGPCPRGVQEPLTPLGRVGRTHLGESPAGAPATRPI